MLADVSGLRIELPQIEETGCFGAALAARVDAGVYSNFSDAQRSLQHPTHAIAGRRRAGGYQRKYCANTRI